MKCKLIILNLVILLGVLNAEPLTQEAIKQELTSVMRAPYIGEKAVILKHTHPKIIEVSGGRENVEKAIDHLQKTLRDGGVTFDTVKIGKPYSYVTTKANEFFLVDVTLVLKKGDQKHVNELTQVAVKSVGSEDWCYIDSSGLSDELLRKLFPQLPRSFTLKKAQKQDVADQPATALESKTKSEGNKDEKVSTLGSMTISYPSEWNETVLSPNSLQIFSEHKMTILGEEIQFGVLFEKKENSGVTIDTLLQILQNNLKASGVNLIEEANKKLDEKNPEFEIGNVDGYKYKKVERDGNVTYDLITVATLKDGEKESKNVTHSSFHVDEAHYYSVSLTYPSGEGNKFSPLASKVIRSIKIKK